ncbi:hypothetical protein ACQKEO_13325 [Exiguobacterium artemiae]|uniref:hypothetical protein n=1 Tax=Exiguobacterium artemiae TaxID=340145 RepID=UPI003D044CE4
MTESFLHVFLRLSDEDVPYFIKSKGDIAREDHQMLVTGARVVDETAVFADRTKDGVVDDDGKLGDDETP